jgi:predicted ATPase
MCGGMSNSIGRLFLTSFAGISSEEAKRVSQQYQDEAKQMGQEYQHQAERVGQQFQKAAETGVSSILRSWGELNRGWTAMAAEVNEYSKTVFSNATRTMEQLAGLRFSEPPLYL